MHPITRGLSCIAFCASPLHVINFNHQHCAEMRAMGAGNEGDLVPELKDTSTTIEARWRERLAEHLAEGHLGRALHYLARIVDAPPSLFDELFADERRIAWLL